MKKIALSVKGCRTCEECYYIENRCVKSIHFSHIEPTHFKLIHLLYCMLGTTHVIDEKDIETVRDDMKRLCWHAIYLRWFEYICVREIVYVHFTTRT